MIEEPIHIYSKLEYHTKILFIAWLLVLGKCFILEYYIQLLSLPINSVFYIWSLSISLLVVLSFMNFKGMPKLVNVTSGGFKFTSLANLAFFLVLIFISIFVLLIDIIVFPKLMTINFFLLGIFLLINALNNKSQWLSFTAIFLILSSLPFSTCNIENIFLYSSFILITLAIIFIFDLISFRKNSILID